MLTFLSLSNIQRFKIGDSREAQASQGSDQTDMEASPSYENSEMSSQLFKATVDLHTKATSEESQKKQVQSLERCDGPLNEVKGEKVNSKTERRWKEFKAQWNKTFSFKVKLTSLLNIGLYINMLIYVQYVFTYRSKISFMSFNEL